MFFRVFFFLCSLFLFACQNIEHAFESGYDEPEHIVLGDPQMSVVESEEVLEAQLPEAQVHQYPVDEDGDFLNLWDRVASQLVLYVPLDQERVQKEIAWFLKHPEYMQRVSKRSASFLYMVVDKIEKEKLPMDLALLPIVESAFNPMATSYVGAAGLWQFMPYTGVDYGLYRNWWYDDRRDVFKSTDAALKYLSYLGEFFDDDWEHALAAYNTGQGRVARHKKYNTSKGLGTDFWSLKLPRETRAYVPKLLALSYILKNRSYFEQKEGLSYFTPILNEPVITQVDVDSQIDVSMIAKFSGLDEKQVRLFNPWIKRWATPPKRKVKVTLPISNVSQFNTTLAQVPKKKWTSGQYQQVYIVRSGDNLSRISRRLQVPLSVIKQTNNIKGSRIYKGQKLVVHRNVAPSQWSSLADANQSKKRISKQIHTVRSGESLWTISRKFNVSYKQIARWNRISVNAPLRTGKRLVVYQSPKNASIYKVRRGDSLGLIADIHGVGLSRLLRANSLSRSSIIRPGDVLRIPR